MSMSERSPVLVTPNCRSLALRLSKERRFAGAGSAGVEGVCVMVAGSSVYKLCAPWPLLDSPCVKIIPFLRRRCNFVYTRL
ncbi:hypothetical protein DFAR_3060015 [Desulfarculales bacterium]